MVIGGASIYKQMLPLADRLYITLVHAEIEGDAHFPEIPPNVWGETSRKDFPIDAENSVPYSFIIMDKIIHTPGFYNEYPTLNLNTK